MAEILIFITILSIGILKLEIYRCSRIQVLANKLTKKELERPDLIQLKRMYKGSYDHNKEGSFNYGIYKRNQY